jgi:hypothetical protein
MIQIQILILIRIMLFSSLAINKPTKNNFLLFTYCRYYIISLQRWQVKKQFKPMFFLTFLMLTEVERSGPPVLDQYKYLCIRTRSQEGQKTYNPMAYGSGSGTLVINRIL